ncbi:unnamed protein product [Rotaria sordida]|uniref:Uncharacterized protein n=1 Tax=Rotaria sordida TaxID=392033 RepID=A0A818KH82_9BILA|nr:unnamed protein product [Rotaria sordida]CAF3557689.1 unnamed protein product [Rotaria sordida]
MIDIREWFWFGIHLFVYSIFLFIIFTGLIYIFAIGYYWFVVRYRSRNSQEINIKLQSRSFVFHTLSFQISNNEIIVLHVQISPLEKQLIELAQLNGQQYKISSFEIEDEQVNIIFVELNNRLTIKHEYIEQQSCQTNRSYFVHEYTFIWSSPNYRTCFNDKFNLIDTGYWYGGATQKTVYWPINEFVTKRQAMIPHDAYKNMFGSVCERYWLSSFGLALFVDPLVPLFVSMNKKYLELISEYRTPYRQKLFIKHEFQYKLLQHVNIRDLHITMINRYLGKPIDIPDYRMIIEPIWSTWAQFKQNINEEKILNYAEEIVKRNFPRSQICIDDNWTPHYGTLDFDRNKFPDPKQMIKKLKKYNFRVTLWIHPFISCKSLQFINYWRRGLLMNMNILSSLFDLIIEHSYFLQIVFDDFLSNSKFQFLINFIKYIYQKCFLSLPGISLWWNGFAGVLDFTNDKTRQEYIFNLERLQKLYDIDNFKFDAGEVKWLPIFSSFINSSCQQISIDKTTLVITPALHSYLYAQLAYYINTNNRLQEVRIGFRTQILPIFIRIIDKDSNWSYENGLRSLLPSIFNLSLLGYPFILPDMVGGNGYGLTITRTRLPQRELYIRWLQLNVLLPAIQFSFPPWLYNDEQVVRIAHKCLKIRERFRSVLLSTAKECVQYGTPMIRPLWFYDPYDINAQICDNEYMLGNNLLVAPVLEENINELKIYLPQGTWKCIHTEQIYEGNQSYSYPVTIEDIPIFERC